MSQFTRLHETGTLDDRMTCPYNTSHVVTGYKFQTHLINCRKQSKKAADITICPYNQIHHILTTDMPEHLKVCPQYLHFQRTLVARKINPGRSQFMSNGQEEFKPKEAEELGMSGISRLIQRPVTPPPPPTEEDISEWQ